MPAAELIKMACNWKKLMFTYYYFTGINKCGIFSF